VGGFDSLIFVGVARGVSLLGCWSVGLLSGFLSVGLSSLGVLSVGFSLGVGLFLVGLDVIGEHLTEINVTSPTGMVEIAAQTPCNPASVFMDALEAL
jgi:hypothetical protein